MEIHIRAELKFAANREEYTKMIAIHVIYENGDLNLDRNIKIKIRKRNC